jgi:hypothetical protein
MGNSKSVEGASQPASSTLPQNLLKAYLPIGMCLAGGQHARLQVGGALLRQKLLHLLVLTTSVDDSQLHMTRARGKQLQPSHAFRGEAHLLPFH